MFGGVRCSGSFAEKLMWLGALSKKEDVKVHMTKANELGKGGFGKVYRGEYLGRPVAVKVAIVPDDPQQARAFEDEILLQRTLQHPLIVPVSTVCEDGTSGWMLVSPIYKGSLNDAIEKRWQCVKDRRQAHGLVANIAQALQFLHSKRVAHRDLKPDNVLVCARTFAEWCTDTEQTPNKDRVTCSPHYQALLI